MTAPSEVNASEGVADTIERKRCYKCKLFFTKDNFYSDKSNSQLLASSCRDCSKKAAYSWRERNRARTRQTAREWAAKNRERVRANRKRYYAENKEKEREAMRRWEKKNRPSRNKNQTRTRIIRRYGITIERYEEMFKEQNGTCAICHGISLDGKRLHIDHDHRTGTIRGLLCQKCNMALGSLNDDVSLFNASIEYLLKSKEKEKEIA